MKDRANKRKGPRVAAARGRSGARRQREVAALLAAGRAHHEAGDLPAAAAAWRAVLQRAPEHAEALHLLGIAALIEGRADEAAPLIERALRRRPDFPEACNSLGLALAATGRNEDAIAAYRRALALHPGAPQVLTNLGNALLAAGRAEDAVAAYGESLAAAPGDAETSFNLGTARLRTGDREAAKAAYADALKADAGLVAALNNLVHLLGEDGQWAEVRALAAGLTQVRPALAAPWFHLGHAQARLGDSDAADSLAAYLERDPDDALGAALVRAATAGAPPPPRHSAAFVRRFYEEKSFAGLSPGQRGDDDGGGDGGGNGGGGYRGHRIVLDALGPYLAARPGLQVLDAGCGSGRIGREIRPAVARLVGVDLSPGMVARARDSGAYDEVALCDLESHLSSHRAAYDLVVAAAVLVHYGDLGPVVRLVRDALRPGGAFLFTVFKAAESEGGPAYTVAGNRLFAHSRDHVAATLGAAGFAAWDIVEAVHEYHGTTPLCCYRVLASL